MKTRPVLNCLAAAGLATLVPFASLRAQQAPTYVPPPQYQTPPGYPPPSARPPAPPPPPSSYYVSPMEFLPTFGRKFGDMFRRVFYGDAPPRGQPPQGYPPQGGGRSLDHPPRGYARGTPPPAYQPPAQSVPRYEVPPRQQAAPRYETPPAPQTSPPSRNSTATPPPRSSSQPAPRPPTRSQSPVATQKSTPKPPPQSVAPSQPTARQPAVESPPRQEPKAASKQVAESPPEKKPEAAPSGGAFLKGKRTNKPGRVISPYPPYQELDVSGLSSGSLALDPTTQKVFEVP